MGSPRGAHEDASPASRAARAASGGAIAGHPEAGGPQPYALPGAYLRLIGHECGHEYFDADTYAAALKEHEDEVAEDFARTLLEERMPGLGRTLIEARTVFRDIAAVLDFQERAVAGITKKAVQHMRRSRVGGQLTIDVESDAADERGRKVIEKRVVATAEGLDALVMPDRLLGDLNAAVVEGDRVWIIRRDEIVTRLAAKNRHEVIVAAKAVRRLDSILASAHEVRNNMGILFTAEGLTALSNWGRHSHCPTPFWIEVADRYSLGKTQVFTWRRDAKRAAFAQVVVEDAEPEPAEAVDGAIEIELVGARVRIGREADARMAVAVIGALRAGR